MKNSLHNQNPSDEVLVVYLKNQNKAKQAYFFAFN